MYPFCGTLRDGGCLGPTLVGTQLTKIKHYIYQAIHNYFLWIFEVTDFLFNYKGN